MIPGAKVGPYQIVSPLGSGGMGEVFLATDTRLERRVALKLLPSTDEVRRRRFMAEARAAAALAHPNVAIIYDVGEADGVSYISMEFVEGRTLSHPAETAAMTTDRVAEIGRQVADALQAAHERGIVHRDIKPANVMITAKGQVKVLDFGLAKLMPSVETEITQEVLTNPGSVMGTVPYMSPEQAIGESVDHRTDLFSLGVTLYELLARRRPFGGTTTLQIVESIRHAEPEPLWRSSPDVPAELDRIVRKCLEKRPDRRYQSAKEVAIDLTALKQTLQRGAEGRPDRMPEHNLPAELTSFVGREQEVSELARLLASSRLVSLVGAGGAGKTRLALRLASMVVRDFPDGVWLVDLAPISAAELVPQSIAAAVGIREGRGRSLRDALVENLRQRQMLIVLDNCEHLIEACAEISETLLYAAGALRIVATSREPLGATGETVWRVRSLTVPDERTAPTAELLSQYEATKLFIDRAKAIDPDFAATPQNARAITHICQRLDGIPLAIELAAARVSVLSLEQIDSRLQDRFRLLTGGRRTAVPRQRTLEATVDWSYHLLSGAERELLARLSVFPSGWTLEASEQVCGGDGIEPGDVLDLLSRLVSKSLVTLESDADQRRYRYLESVRQYARERLLQSGGMDRLRQRHFEFFYKEFRGAIPVLNGPDQLPMLRRLRLERDSVRAALEWGLESPALGAEALELAGALFWYWTKLGLFREGRQWLERALAAPVAGRQLLRARALIGLAHMDYFQGKFDAAAARVEEALALGRAIGDPWVIEFALFMSALTAFERGELERATELSVAARDAAETCGEPVLLAGPLMVLGNIALANGRTDEAQRLIDEAVDICRRYGEWWSSGILLSIAAALRVVRGEIQMARTQAIEALSLCQQLGDPRGTAWSLEVLASVLGAEGLAEDAARLCGASDSLLEIGGGFLPPTIGWIRDHYVSRARQSLGDESFSKARAEGRAMPIEEVIQLARQP